MPISEAPVATAHGSRRLQRPCKHRCHEFTADLTAERGIIVLGDAPRCEGVIVGHIGRGAFREEPAFDWHPLGD